MPPAVLALWLMLYHVLSNAVYILGRSAEWHWILHRHTLISATPLFLSLSCCRQSFAVTTVASTCLVWVWNGSKAIWSSMSCFASTLVQKGDLCIALPGATFNAACRIHGALQSGAISTELSRTQFVAVNGFNYRPVSLNEILLFIFK